MGVSRERNLGWELSRVWGCEHLGSLRDLGPLRTSDGTPPGGEGFLPCVEMVPDPVFPPALLLRVQNARCPGREARRPSPLYVHRCVDTRAQIRMHVCMCVCVL